MRKSRHKHVIPDMYEIRNSYCISLNYRDFANPEYTYVHHVPEDILYQICETADYLFMRLNIQEILN